MAEVEIYDSHSYPTIIMRGDRFHILSGDGFTTHLRDGSETLEGYVPDPEFVEPEESSEGFDVSCVEGFKRTLFHFTVLHEGWELDNDAWVVELQDGSQAIVTTSHGGTYVAKPEEFQKKLAEYERIVADTKRALEMVKHPPA